MNNTKNPKKNKRIDKRTKILLSALISLIGSFLFVLFALHWQKSYTLMAYCNSFYFSGFIFFFIGWIVLMANQNILSPLIYGLKSFFLMFAGKKPSSDYFGYVKEREENPISKIFIYSPFLAAIPNIIVAVILHILLP